MLPVDYSNDRDGPSSTAETERRESGRAITRGQLGMTATIPPVSDAARVELAFRGKRANGATANELAEELSMIESIALACLWRLVAEGKAEQIAHTARFRVIR
jgi:hypothetical protein